MIREFKLSTKQGRNLYERGCHYEGTTLEQVYNTCSQAKKDSFDGCYHRYLQSDNHAAFSICSHNCFSYSVSWLCTIHGENVMIIETSQNSYIVWLDR